MPDVKYNPKDQTPAHRRAIELALENEATLKSIERTFGPEFSGSGANTAWQYNYRCIVTLPDDPTDRELLAVLFAQYHEKSE